MHRLLVLTALVAAGCATPNPIASYPAFPGRYEEARATRVLADVMITDDVSGRTDQVTVTPNQTFARALSDSLSAWIGARGYAVDQTYDGAVGAFYMEPETRYHVRTTHGGLVDSSQTGPYVLDQEARAEPVVALALRDTAGASALRVPDAPEALVTLVVRGRRVPVGKSILQGIASGIVSGVLTGGLVSASVWQQSHTAVQLSVLDAATGEVLWRDSAVKGGTASEKQVWDAVRWMVGRLPDRPR